MLAVTEEELNRRKMQLDADAKQWALEEETLREQLRELELTKHTLADESAFHEAQLSKVPDAWGDRVETFCRVIDMYDSHVLMLQR